MLRITAEESQSATTLRLEGKLKGAWVAELEATYLARKRAGAAKRLILDIDNLTATDQAGRYLLALIANDGGEIAYSGPEPAHLLGTRG